MPSPSPSPSTSSSRTSGGDSPPVTPPSRVNTSSVSLTETTYFTVNDAVNEFLLDLSLQLDDSQRSSLLQNIESIQQGGESIGRPVSVPVPLFSPSFSTSQAAFRADSMTTLPTVHIPEEISYAISVADMPKAFTFFSQDNKKATDDQITIEIDSDSIQNVFGPNHSSLDLHDKDIVFLLLAIYFCDQTYEGSTQGSKKAEYKKLKNFMIDFLKKKQDLANDPYLAHFFLLRRHMKAKKSFAWQLPSPIAVRVPFNTGGHKVKPQNSPSPLKEIKEGGAAADLCSYLGSPVKEKPFLQLDPSVPEKKITSHPLTKPPREYIEPLIADDPEKFVDALVSDSATYAVTEKTQAGKDERMLKFIGLEILRKLFLNQNYYQLINKTAVDQTIAAWLGKKNKKIFDEQPIINATADAFINSLQELYLKANNEHKSYQFYTEVIKPIFESLRNGVVQTDGMDLETLRSDEKEAVLDILAKRHEHASKANFDCKTVDKVESPQFKLMLVKALIEKTITEIEQNGSEFCKGKFTAGKNRREELFGKWRRIVELLNSNGRGKLPKGSVTRLQDFTFDRFSEIFNTIQILSEDTNPNIGSITDAEKFEFIFRFRQLHNRVYALVTDTHTRSGANSSGFLLWSEHAKLQGVLKVYVKKLLEGRLRDSYAQPSAVFHGIVFQEYLETALDYFVAQTSTNYNPDYKYNQGRNIAKIEQDRIIEKITETFVKDEYKDDIKNQLEAVRDDLQHIAKLKLDMTRKINGAMLKTRVTTARGATEKIGHYMRDRQVDKLVTYIKGRYEERLQAVEEFAPSSDEASPSIKPFLTLHPLLAHESRQEEKRESAAEVEFELLKHHKEIADFVSQLKKNVETPGTIKLLNANRSIIYGKKYTKALDELADELTRLSFNHTSLEGRSFGIDKALRQIIKIMSEALEPGHDVISSEGRGKVAWKYNLENVFFDDFKLYAQGKKYVINPAYYYIKLLQVREFRKNGIFKKPYIRRNSQVHQEYQAILERALELQHKLLLLKDQVAANSEKERVKVTFFEERTELFKHNEDINTYIGNKPGVIQNYTDFCAQFDGQGFYRENQDDQGALDLSSTFSSSNGATSRTGFFNWLFRAFSCFPGVAAADSAANSKPVKTRSSSWFSPQAWWWGLTCALGLRVEKGFDKKIPIHRQCNYAVMFSHHRRLKYGIFSALCRNKWSHNYDMRPLRSPVAPAG